MFSTIFDYCSHFNELHHEIVQQTEKNLKVYHSIIISFLIVDYLNSVNCNVNTLN